MINITNEYIKDLLSIGYVSITNMTIGELHQFRWVLDTKYNIEPIMSECQEKMYLLRRY